VLIKTKKKKKKKNFSLECRRQCLKNNKKTRGVSYCGLAIYIKKYFKAKEEL
jgi:hypothetical protein